MLRYRLMLFVLLIMAILSSCEDTPQPTPPTTYVTPSSTSALTLTSTTAPDHFPTGALAALMAPPAPPGTAEVMAKSYYQALKDHQYIAAYADLDANATDTTTGQKLTLQVFIQIAQDSENAGGPISSFSVAAHPPLVVMTVSRSGGPYHVHLQVKQEGSAWKITSLDRI
ncbi:hypothetical protein [Dictyobacter formicarum]|uniref:DUF3828 domain-containing protein n=1 Tax=Dictyobacter formicarum TaxID=2778368 RepID=A0ABQ3VRZ9_9CHLR|nr:hypothetical protein [Dictyobacter formicarum]GHO87886.1 hypothetical protein KSZ_58920 [Dictyobacter formicarum]